MDTGWGERTSGDWLRLIIASLARMTPETLLSAGLDRAAPIRLPRVADRSYRYPREPNRHPYPELCVGVEGDSVFDIEDRVYKFGPGSLAVVEPGVRHWEGYRRKDRPYAVAWFWSQPADPLGPAITGRISEYRAGTDWQLGCFFHLRAARASRAFDRLAPPGAAMRDEWLEPLRADLLVLTSELLRQAVNRPAVTGSAPRHEAALRDIHDLLDHHIHKPVAVADLARGAGLTPNYLNHLFTKWTGQGIHAYLTQRRMEAALQLCRETDLLLKEIAWRVGYGDPLYFSRAFRQYHGFPPSEARGA